MTSFTARAALFDEEPDAIGMAEPEPVGKDEEDAGEWSLSGGETIIANEGERVCTGRDEGPGGGGGGSGGGGGGGADDCGTARRFGDRPGVELAPAWSSLGRRSSMCFRFFGGCGVPRGVSAGWRRCVDGGLDGVDMVPHRDHGGGGGTLFPGAELALAMSNVGITARGPEA
jgi:hypothetical protein